MRILVFLLLLVTWQASALEKALYIEVKEYAHFPELSGQSFSKEFMRKWQTEKSDSHSLPLMTVDKDGTAYYPIKKNVEAFVAKNKPISFLYWHGRVTKLNGQFALVCAETKAAGNDALFLSNLTKQAKAGSILIVHSESSSQISSEAFNAVNNFNGSIIFADDKVIKELLQVKLFDSKPLDLKVALYELKKKNEFILAGKSLQISEVDIKTLSRKAAALEKKLKSFKSFKNVATLYSQGLLYKKRATSSNSKEKQFYAWQEVVKLNEKALAKLHQHAYQASYKELNGDVLKGLGHPDWQELVELSEKAKAHESKEEFAEAAKVYKESTDKLKEISKLLKAHLEGLVAEAKKSGDTASAQSYLEALLKLNPSMALTDGIPGYVHENKVKMRFSFIQAGKFKMGSPSTDSSREYDELQRSVNITKGFYMGQTEVTVAQWRSVMGETDASKGKNSSNPMVNVSWEEAVKFCKKLSQKEGLTYRLPTEAEWEYACKAGKNTRYSSGNELDSKAFNVKESGLGAMWEAGRNGAANAWGIYDMHGNVWEWCWDWSAPYDPSNLVDPQGISEEQAIEEEYESRVVRGGSYADGQVKSRSANRWEYSPYVRSALIGFRVVLELKKK